MSDELPEGWRSIKLGALFDFKYGKGLPQGRRNARGSIKVYGSNGIVGLHDSALAKGPAIIVGRKGSVGQVHLSPERCWPIDTTYFIDEFPAGLPPDYWALYLRSLRLGQREKSSAIPGINREDIYAIEVPLPPLREQRRIVAKLEELFGKVDACRQRLAKIPVLLKRFRQSVLSAACSGRLTADWREENRSVEPYPVESMESDEEFPAGWRATRLGSVTTLVTSGSRGWAKYYSDSGAVFIRAQNINTDFLNLSDIAFVRPPESAEGLRTRVQEHDILVTITGANVTKSALVERPIEEAYVSQHVALVRLKDIRLSKLIFYSIVSPSHGRRQLLAAAYGQGKPGLNLNNIRDVVVGLPPRAEQQEIERRVEVLFSLAEQIEMRYAKARKHVEKLTQSILAKAFRGELVPTEAELARREGRDYEDAQALLEGLSARTDGVKPARERRTLERGYRRHRRAFRSRKV